MSITVRLDPKVKAAIATIDEHAWTPIEYTDAIFDDNAGRWISRAEVAEIDFTAFGSRKASEQIPGRLVVRRIPDLNPPATMGRPPCSTPGATTPSSPPPTSTPSPQTRPIAGTRSGPRGPQNSALAHLPSGRFGANAAWLVLATIAFNLTRAAATLTGPTLAKARTGTIRRTLISVPARIASSARRLTLHLPRNWPWQSAWNTLFHSLFGRNQPLLA